jgi:hypothetical protein
MASFLSQKLATCSLTLKNFTEKPSTPAGFDGAEDRLQLQNERDVIRDLAGKYVLWLSHLLDVSRYTRMEE